MANPNPLPGPGRSKGSKNKDTEYAQKFLELHGWEWWEKVWGEATDPSNKASDRLMALQMIGKKVFADRKSVEAQVETTTQKIEITWAANKVPPAPEVSEDLPE